MITNTVFLAYKLICVFYSFIDKKEKRNSQSLSQYLF